MLKNCSGLLTGGVLIYESDFFKIKNSSFRNCFGGNDSYGGAIILESMYFPVKSEFEVSDCEFTNNTSLYGGGLYAFGVPVKIENSTFSSNSAKEGGAVYLESSFNENGKFKIYNSSFNSNKASLQGGAIKWDHYRPQLKDVTFTNNSALYGNDLASYPTAIIQVGSNSSVLQNTSYPVIGKVTNAPPGQAISESIQIGLYDQYGSLVKVDKSSEAKITTDDSSLGVAGGTTAVAVSGVLSFKDLIIYAKPSSKFYILVDTSSIDPKKQESSNDQFEYVNKGYLEVTTRACQMGETETSKSCDVCERGTYSLSPQKQCKKCPNNAECLGNFTIFPEPGYWRASIHSDKIFKCKVPEACLGSVDYTSQLGNCSKGYTGNICGICEEGYSKLANGSCSPCPDPGVNFLILGFLVVAALVVCSVLVYSTLRSAYKPKSVLSIYFKIFTNYVQLVYLTTQFNLEWPDYVLDFFEIQKNTATASEQIFSVDCYVEAESSGSYFTKLVVIALLPLIVAIISGCFWGGVAYFKGKVSVLKNELVATMIILFFLIHPTVTRFMFSVFSCKEILEGEFWLNESLDVRCWDGEHTFYALVVALPSIIVWVVGTPALIFAVMLKRRRYLTNFDNKTRFGFVFNGYRLSEFYWEFVVMARKVVVISLAVFFSEISVEIQAILSLGVLAFFLVIQSKNKPFTFDHMNTLELLGISTATITIYCGIYYLSGDLGEFIKFVLFLCMVTSNLLFTLYWLKYSLKAVLDMLINSSFLLRKLFRRTDTFDKDMYNEQPALRGYTYHEGQKLYTLLKRKEEEIDTLEEFQSMNDIYLEAFRNFKDEDFSHDQPIENRVSLFGGNTETSDSK